MSRRRSSRPPAFTPRPTPPRERPGDVLVDGEVLHRQGRLGLAIKCYRRVLETAPEKGRVWYRALFMAALVAYQQRIYAEAELLLEKVAEDPTEWRNPNLHYNRGMVFAVQGKVEQAIEAYRTCLALDPRNASAEVHLGNLYRDLGDLETAELCYERVRSRGADDPHADYNLAFVALARGDLGEGFKLYDRRWATDGHVSEYGRRDLTAPRWHVTDPAHRVLVFCDQGFGDAIQFSRYLPWLARQAREVILEVQPGVVRLFQPLEAQLGIRVVRRGDPLPAHDRVVSILSLATEHGTTLDTIPPVLTPNLPQDRPVVGRKGPAKRLGLVWAGSAHHHNDRKRSADLGALLPWLAQVPGVEWVSLQLEHRGAELLHLLPRHLPQLEAVGSRVVDASGLLKDFATTARILRDECDGLVCVDTSVAHLAGMFQVPTWLMLPHVPEWRWLEGRADSPWYPSLRLVRQTADGDWASVGQKLLTLLSPT
jgi:hypothetical protein